MNITNAVGCILVLGYALMAAEPVNVLDLGVKNDGSADISEIVNAASAKHALHFPAGLYKVSHPLKIANSVTGVGYARLPHVDATRTWFISDIGATNANCAVIEAKSGKLINLENFNIQLKGREKGIALETKQSRFFAINGIGIYGVASVGLDVYGSGSRPVFADRMTIFGSRTEPQKSRGIIFRGSVDCRLTDTEVMGVCVALELFNGHTYANNLHLWTGIMGGPADVSWWKGTRAIVLGPGANFAGSQIYPDTSYYAIEQVGDGAICELSNVMYWEDGSVKYVKDRTGTFYHRPANATGKLVVHGGLIGVGGKDDKPGCTRSYVPNETMRDVMLKSAYAIKAGNLDWLCTGDSLPDYTVQYAEKGWCKVADLVMESAGGACSGIISCEDGTAWRVRADRKAGSAANVKIDSISSDADAQRVKTCEEDGVVRVYVQKPTADAEMFRFRTESMGSRFRPIDHGSLRTMQGKERYREVREAIVGGVLSEVPSPQTRDLPTGCPDFSVEAPRTTTGAVVQAADFGVSEANEHNAEAANRAFAEARRVKASKVVFRKGVYRCFDGPGLQIEGLEDCVVDGGGSTFVFRRVVPNQDDPSILVEGYGNVEIKDCRRTEVGNFNVDWDWEHDPLGFWCTLVEAVEGKEDDTSYLDFDLDKPHPKYPNPVAIQLLTPMAKDKKGPRMTGKHTGSVYFGTSAGTMGAKMQWLSPSRMRVWPHVRPDYGYVSSYSSNRYSPKSNRALVRRLKAEELGNSFAITHHYYGMNGIVLTSNRHFTLRNVDIWATWGLGVETRGAQKWWQLVNVNVRSKPGENYPVTATADAHHVVQSQGYAKMIDCEVTGHRDDHFNYHDRTQIAWKKGARTLEVVNNRGVAYTLFKVGTLLRLRQQNFAAIDWKGRIVKIDGDFITVDCDLPEQKGLFFVLIDAEYATENFLFKNCRFHDSSFSRGLVLGNNLTFEGCTFGPMNGQALRFQSCYTYNVWCEGIGCRNVVVRNCRFENVLDNYTVGGVSSQIYTALRIPWKKYSVMGHVKIRHPEFAKAIADYEAKGVPVTPSGDAVGNMLVEGCTFVNPRGYLWYIENGSGFWFRDNNIQWTDPNWPRLPYAGRIRVDAATDVHMPPDLLDRGE